MAVLPVILFHAGFNAFRGGYVGVDVFFVISGYLITSIIVNDCDAGKFSLATFYERRARRILPALFVVMAACIPFAWLWMLPVQTQAFTRSMLATLAFVPNLYFWSTTQYFGNAAEEFPLLHTWSLGVEEQFYLLFPLLIWFLWRFGLRAIVVATLVFALVSLGLSEWAWRSGKLSSNFFFPVTRAWELMIGAMLALAWRTRPIYERLSKGWCNCLSLLGLAMLVYAVAAFDSETPMPSIYALAPALGTALVIASARRDTLAHRILSHRALVRVGLISYGAYLWHQPLFAFARIKITSGPEWWVFLILIVVTLGLAYLTWRFVETPFRGTRRVLRAQLVQATVAVGMLFVLVGVASELTHGFISRLATEDVGLAAMVDTTAQGQYLNSRFFALAREFSGTKRRRVLVIGDSYAQDFTNSILESGRLVDMEIRTYYIPASCQIYFGEQDISEHLKPQDRPSCKRERDVTMLRRRVAQADIVVFSGSWQSWAVERLPGTILELGVEPQQSLFVVGPKRIGRINIRELLQQPAHLRAAITQPVSAEVLDIEEQLRRVLPPGTFVSMQQAVCGVTPRCSLFTKSGELISFDGTHLTPAGAVLAGRQLFSVQPLVAIAGNSN